jgi:sugar O-acyltransferase (sialic acid O-acetyltransferase NeuD family)
VSYLGEVYVIGAGGHAKVVIRALQDLGHKVTMVFDDDPRLHGGSLLGIPIVGPVERILEQPCRPTVIAIGNNVMRRRIAIRYNVPWLTVVHPLAMVDPSVRLGCGTVVLARAVIQIESYVGDHVIINHAATVDHDCVVEDYVHLAPGVHLAGNVTVEEAALLGIGSAAIPGMRIGAETTVGAGAAVIHHLPAHVVAVGVPAKIVKSSSRVVPRTNPLDGMEMGITATIN